MPNMTKLALLAAATLALAAMTNTASQAASNHNQGMATDFSSQQKKGGKSQGGNHPSGGGQPHFQNKQFNRPHNNGPKPSFSGNNNKRNFKVNTGQQQNFQKKNSGPRTFTAGPNAKIVTTHTQFRGLSAQGASSASIRGRNFSVWRGGGYRVRRGGGWRTFVALSTLGALAIGGVSYYPYAYLSAPVDYCDGLTEDGCQLSWQNVETIEGDIIGQCVAYCPWQ